MKPASTYGNTLRGMQRSFTEVPIILGDGKRTRVARATCAEAGCNSSHDVHLNVALPPEIILKKFHQAGWHFNSQGYPKCPACQARPKKPHLVIARAETQYIAPLKSNEPVPMKVENMTKAPEEETNNARPATATNLAIMRRLFSELEQHFDADLGRYAKGQSDDEIAKALGLSPVFVRETREKAFGPLKLDPQLAEIEDRLSKLATRQEKALAEIAAIDGERTAIARAFEAYLKQTGHVVK